MCLQYKPLETLWKKEKLLITNNFSFTRSVFYPFGELHAIFIQFETVICKLFQFGRVQNLTFGEGLRRDGRTGGRTDRGKTEYPSLFNPLPNKPWFLRIWSISLLKTQMSIFSFSHSVFYPFGELSAIFIKFENILCQLFQFGSLNSLFGKRLKKLWEKEKMLVTSIFSFYHNVFYPYQHKFQFFNTHLSSANSSNLDRSRNLSFGQESKGGCIIIIYIGYKGYIDSMVFDIVFNSISVISWWPVYLSMPGFFQPVLCTVFFPSHWCFPT